MTRLHHATLIPLPAAYLRRLRETGLDDLGQPVEHHLAQGGEPCRDVLRRALPGEALLLASYCPFTVAGPYKAYGPVFVLAQASTEVVDYRTLPAAPAGDYFGEQFVLRAYSAQERIVDAVLSSPARYEADLAALFAAEQVAFVLARFAGYGCYGCRIERFAEGAVAIS